MITDVDIRELMPCEPEPRETSLNHYALVYKRTGSLDEINRNTGAPLVLNWNGKGFILDGNQRYVFCFINGIWQAKAEVKEVSNPYLLKIVQRELNSIGIYGLADLANKVKHLERFVVK